MLLSADLQKHFINEKSIAISLGPSSQSPCRLRSKLAAPQSNRLVAYLNATLWHQIFDIAMAEVKSMVEPNGVLNNFRRKPVTFVHLCRIHDQILTDWELTCQYRKKDCPFERALLEWDIGFDGSQAGINCARTFLIGPWAHCLFRRIILSITWGVLQDGRDAVS